MKKKINKFSEKYQKTWCHEFAYEKSGLKEGDKHEIWFLDSKRQTFDNLIMNKTIIVW
jgi:hypothetical protein